MAAQATWIIPPEKLADAIKDYGRRMLLAVFAVAVYVGQGMQDDARRRAPWEDRTGNARSGLFFAVDGFGLGTVYGQLGSFDKAEPHAAEETAVVSGTTDRLVLVLGHTMYYGKYLELSNGGRYAIVLSTMMNRIPQLERMLKGVLQ